MDSQVDALREEIERLLAHPAPLHEGLLRLRDRVDEIAAAAAALQLLRAREEAQVEEVLAVMTSLARLDFHPRAAVHGDGPLDALAQVANMMSEELEAAQEAMTQARAAAEAATLAKSRFLAHMSHEIRTPLTALIGFAELLSAPRLSESERLNYAMIVRRNGEHLLSVINDVLDLSRIEAGRLVVEQIACEPARILAEVASLMRVRAAEGGLSFSVRLDSPIPATVLSDPTRVRQILLNLVSNAVKFTPRGAVSMSASLESGRLVFAVTDTGIGIDPAQLAMLFQPFTQADLSMSRRFGGSGLGLAISRALAEALGGEISVESEPGRGSTFRLSLPVSESGPLVDSLVPGVDEARGDVEGVPRFSGNVLVVEDGIDNQLLVTTILHRHGLEVAVAGDGREAVRRVLEAWRAGTPFDLVLMDMQMPVMDGYQATARLRAEGYRGSIVALTAHALEGERERCVAAGCDEYLRKPILRAELLGALARHLVEDKGDDKGEAEGAPIHSTFAADPEMAEITARFVAALPERLAALRIDEPESLARLTHQLKGAAGGYGFPEISTAAAELERLATAGAPRLELQRALDALGGLCARARAGRP